MPKHPPLSTNGLVVPDDFPASEYESIYLKAASHLPKQQEIYEQFGSAWNAVAYRFVAVAEYEAILKVSLVRTNAPPPERYEQERDLFGFFSSGFSVFEAAFYGIFSLGALIAPAAFPTTTPRDQQRISPSSTAGAIAKAFPGDSLNGVIAAVTGDLAYLEWREIRNILTHRAAPGRRFFVSIGGDEEIPDQWKIKDIPLNANMPQSRRAELSRLLSTLLNGIEQFSKSRL